MSGLQYQYVELVGPVWTEPVAEKLAWLPRAQQPARALPPHRLGDYVRPEFAALYRADGLEWIPSARQPARGIPPHRLGIVVLDPLPIAAAAVVGRLIATIRIVPSLSATISIDPALAGSIDIAPALSGTPVFN